MRHLFFALFFLALHHGVFSQVTTQGTDFYLTFGNNLNRSLNSPTYPIGLQVRIATSRSTTVTLTFKNDNNSTLTADIPEGGVYTLDLNSTQKNHVYNISGTSNKSLRIQSTAPVSVYALNYSENTTDATHVLPVNNLGTDYYHFSYFQRLSYPDGYTVVATEDGTSVYDNGTLRAGPLSAGQVYSYSGGGRTAPAGISRPIIPLPCLQPMPASGSRGRPQED